MDKTLRNINTIEPVLVHGLDGSTATVNVRTLRLKDFPALLSAQLDMPEQAEIYVGKERGWADKIADESILDVIEAGEKLNADFFGLWLQRLRAAQKRLVPDAPSISSAGSGTPAENAASPGSKQ